MSDEEKNAQQRAQDEQTAASTKKVLSTVAKGVGTLYGGPQAAKAIDAIEKTPAVNRAETDLAKGVNNNLNPQVKENLADNNPKITNATNLVNDFSKGTPDNINLDNHGYNPSLQMPKSNNEPSNMTLNPDTINQSISTRDEPDEELESLRQKHSKKNNINDVAKGEIKLPPEVLILLPVIGIIFLILIFLLVMFYNQINDEENITYDYVDLNTCGRVIFNKDLEPLEEELNRIDEEILDAIQNQDNEAEENLRRERYNLIPSIALDDYVAWLVENELENIEDETLYYDFAIAIKTYLFNNSYMEDNFCFIDETQSDGVNQSFTSSSEYVASSNDKIKEIVNNTHEYVLVVNDQFVDTYYNAFCEDHTDDAYYYLKERNQALDKPWVDENVTNKNEDSDCDNTNGYYMSKYGAYYLSTENDYGWKDILSYYYNGNLEIKRVIIVEMSESGERTNSFVGEINGDLPISSSGFAWPVSGMDAPNTCSRGIGVNNHYGMDIVRGRGTPVYASASGTVIGVGIVGTNGLHWSYGNGVKIKTDNNYVTIYAHFDQPPFVSMGQRVEQGQQIGVVGTTGNSTGYHLHFEVHDPSGGLVDPYLVLSGLPACCGRGGMCSR